MAKYAINAEGVRAMRLLSNRILMCANQVVEANRVLETQILSLSDDLGVYGEPILEIKRYNSEVLKRNYDSIMGLAKSVAKKADQIETLISLGWIGGTGGSPGGPGPTGGTGYKASDPPGSPVPSGSGNPSDPQAPHRASPRDLPCTAYDFQSDSDGNLVYDSPMETDAWLYKKQGTAKLWYQGTCGLCSCANILRLAGVESTEREVLDYAADTRRPDSTGALCEKGHLINPGLNGATCPEDRKAILEHFGIDSGVFPVAKDRQGNPSDENIDTIAKYVSEGRGVIISVHADMLWYDAPYPSGMYHAVTVTSVKKDPQGRILGFYICDSAKGGTTYYPAQKIRQALTGSEMNVTYQIIR